MAAGFIDNGKASERPSPEQRTQAEDRRTAPSSDLTSARPGRAENLQHSLQTHQIKLEMQNEELRRTQARSQ